MSGIAVIKYPDGVPDDVADRLEGVEPFSFRVEGDGAWATYMLDGKMHIVPMQERHLPLCALNDERFPGPCDCRTAE